MTRRKPSTEPTVKGAVDNPHVILCAKCGVDIRKKDCGCDAGWRVGEKENPK